MIDHLMALGIDPHAPFSTCPRKVGEPLDLRIGDDRLVRSSSGAVSYHFGYYTESQLAIRRQMAASVIGLMKATP